MTLNDFIRCAIGDATFFSLACCLLTETTGGGVGKGKNDARPSTKVQIHVGYGGK